MKPKSKFLLNPDHKDFVPRKSRLDFKSLDSGSGFEFGCIVLMAFMYIPLAILIPLSLFFSLWDYWKHEARGIDINVNVVDCQMIKTEENGYRPQVTYFYTIDGIAYNGTHFIPRYLVTCEDYPIGMNLEAQYLPDDPSHVRIIQTNANRALWDSTLLYTGLTCTGIFMVVATIRGILTIAQYILARRNYPLLGKKSVLLDGEIVKAEHKKRVKSGEHYVKITYEFETPDGRLLTRSLSRQREDLKDRELPAVGTPVTVLYADDYAVIVL